MDLDPLPRNKKENKNSFQRVVKQIFGKCYDKNLAIKEQQNGVNLKKSLFLLAQRSLQFRNRFYFCFFTFWNPYLFSMRIRSQEVALKADLLSEILTMLTRCDLQQGNGYNGDGLARSKRSVHRNSRSEYSPVRAAPEQKPPR